MIVGRIMNEDGTRMQALCPSFPLLSSTCYSMQEGRACTSVAGCVGGPDVVAAAPRVLLVC